MPAVVCIEYILVGESIVTQGEYYLLTTEMDYKVKSLSNMITIFGHTTAVDNFKIKKIKIKINQ